MFKWVCWQKVKRTINRVAGQTCHIHTGELSGENHLYSANCEHSIEKSSNKSQKNHICYKSDVLDMCKISSPNSVSFGSSEKDKFCMNNGFSVFDTIHCKFLFLITSKWFWLWTWNFASVYNITLPTYCIFVEFFETFKHGLYEVCTVCTKRGFSPNTFPK